MDLAEVQRLVEQGEGTTLEFKKSTGELRAAMAALCGMLNAAGRGKVIFGVTDDGAVVGQEFAEKTLEEIANESRKLEPKAEVTTTRLDLPSGRTVVIVEARAAEPGPFTFDGRPYLRVGRTTQRMSRDEFDQRVADRLHARKPWDGWPAQGWTIEELDAAEIRSAVRDAVATKRLFAAPDEPPVQVLRRLDLLDGDRLTRAAVILFGENDRVTFPVGELRLARFAGTTKSEFLDNRQYDGNAFHLLDLAERFLRETVPVASRFVPGQMARIDIPRYPPLAVREALINGLIHRDYSVGGGALSLGIYDDRLEVTSTGPLPPGVTVEKLKGLHDSVPRNPLVATTFHRRGLIERWGRGTNKIIEECERAGCPAPDFEDTGLSVVVRFRPVAGARVGKAMSAGTARADRIMEILQRFGPLGPSAILDRLGEPLNLRSLQRDLRRLREAGRVGLEGSGSATRYGVRRGNRRLEGRSRHDRDTITTRRRDTSRRVATGSNRGVANPTQERPQQASEGRLEARIVQLLQQEGPLGARALLSRLGVSVAMRTLQKYLGRLRRGGEIVAIGGGRGTTYRAAQGRPGRGSGIAHESRTNRARMRDSGSRTTTTKKGKGPSRPVRPRPKPRTGR
ncbi:MAG: putative DNA binding domain-containing protein [Acidobacteria bacterium]|nr:putative DNA binding domain-containing protein [Acidobacteriota bacterium]